MGGSRWRWTGRWIGARCSLVFWWWSRLGYTGVARQQTELTRQQLQLARQQMHDTRVLQRAYVGALPGGVSTTTHGELLAHVELKNVGHLPASQVRSVLKFTPSDDGAWSPPNVDDKDLRPAGVLPVGMSVTTGSHGIGVPQPWTKYLYAWGRITYLDGFGKERRTHFFAIATTPNPENPKPAVAFA